MKRLMLLVLLVLVTVFSTQGCIGPCEVRWACSKVRGSGDVVTEERPVSDITGVELATIGNLYIELGDTEKLLIEAEDNLLEYFETEVHRGILTIKTRRNTNLSPREPVNYYLTVKELNRIEISSAGDVEAPDLKAKRFKISNSSAGDLTMGALECTALEVNLSSAGDVDIEELNARTLKVDISSAGTLEIGGGEVDEQFVHLSSAGDYNAEDLLSAEADVSLSSVGSARIQVSDYLDADLSSMGSLYYRGNPRVHQRTSSMGKVKRIGKSHRSRSI